MHVNFCMFTGLCKFLLFLEVDFESHIKERRSVVIEYIIVV